MRTISVAVIVLTILTGCGAPYVRDESPSLVEVLHPGDKLVLSQKLTIAPNSYRVYLQSGEVVGQGNLISKRNRYLADCSFELKQAHYKRYEIEPQAYAVIRVDDYTADAFLDYSYFGVYIYLDTPNHPEILRLDCRHPETVNSAPFTSGLFKRAMGEIVTISRQ